MTRPREGTGIPAPLLIPAAIGVAFLVLPVVGLLVRTPWADLGPRLRDPDRALAASGAAIPDWSGGTRLGEVLKAFLDRWGQRGTARGAVVVVCSDGWERGGTVLLAEQMARLRRLAHTVVWVNPHKGRIGYEPLTGGMQAALPSVDVFVSGHSLAAFEELAGVIARA